MSKYSNELTSAAPLCVVFITPNIIDVTIKVNSSNNVKPLLFIRIIHILLSSILDIITVNVLFYMAKSGLIQIPHSFIFYKL